MDLLKALTGKNPAEYELAAQILVDKPDIELFKKLVNQEDFLFDFVKINVANRIKNACNETNYKNLLQLFDYYSPSYAAAFAEVIICYGDEGTTNEIKKLFTEGSDNQKAYAAKYFLCSDEVSVKELLPLVREYSKSDFEYLSTNAIELLSKYGDTVSKDEAVQKLKSSDEFEQYDAVKFLVTYQAKDTIPLIIQTMKNSSLSENIASEIPYLISLEDLIQNDFDSAMLVLCNIINAIPEIILPQAVIDYSLYQIFEFLYYEKLTSSSALLLRMAKDKFHSLCENEEYLYDCDKNTKEEVFAINKFLDKISSDKLLSLLYEELYEESDFVFFAVDYADNVDELESLLDSKNQTLLLKVLTILKDKQLLDSKHKQAALNIITNPEIKRIVSVL